MLNEFVSADTTSRANIADPHWRYTWTMHSQERPCESNLVGIIIIPEQELANWSVQC